jgi:hypothetical protein
MWNSLLVQNFRLSQAQFCLSGIKLARIVTLAHFAAEERHVLAILIIPAHHSHSASLFGIIISSSLSFSLSCLSFRSSMSHDGASKGNQRHLKLFNLRQHSDTD